MNGLLEKLRRGAIRALGGYVEQVPPPKPQDRALIKEERYRVRKIEVRAMPFDNGPRAEELLQRYKKYSSERLVEMLAKKMLESGALRIEENSAAASCARRFTSRCRRHEEEMKHETTDERRGQSGRERRPVSRPARRP